MQGGKVSGLVKVLPCILVVVVEVDVSTVPLVGVPGSVLLWEKKSPANTTVRIVVTKSKAPRAYVDHLYLRVFLFVLLCSIRSIISVCSFCCG